MSNYSFMKSGFNNLTSETLDNDMINNLYSLVYTFMEKAMHSADTYVKHSGREVITKEDIQLCLKYETFTFLQRPNIMDEVSKWKEILSEELEEDTEEDSEEIINNDIIVNDDNYVPFKKSECSCNLCKEINQIENKWNDWVPHNQIEIILKNAVLKIQ